MKMSMKISPTSTSTGFFTVNSTVYLLNDNGSIIFNGSVHDYMGQAGQAGYAATKGALVSMVRALRLTWRHAEFA
jgi:NAD(P)-dependent dehydrogenase (short-subunit alcohol dehydrogenase family)